MIANRNSGPGGAHFGLFGRQLVHCAAEDGLPTGGYTNSPTDTGGTAAAPAKVFFSPEQQAEVNRIAAEAREQGRRNSKATGGSSDRLDRIEQLLERFATAATPPSPAPPAAPAPVERPPAPAAPSAPAKVEALTSGGITNLMALTPSQLEQLGPWGVRAELEKQWALAEQMNGRPPRPQPPVKEVKVRK